MLTCVDQCSAALCVYRECQNDELDGDSHTTSQLQLIIGFVSWHSVNKLNRPDFLKQFGEQLVV